MPQGCWSVGRARSWASGRCTCKVRQVSWLLVLHSCSKVRFHRVVQACVSGVLSLNNVSCNFQLTEGLLHLRIWNGVLFLLQI